MSSSPFRDLSRRERQLMDAVYELGEATIGDLHERIPDFPSYNAVRVAVGGLVERDLLRHERRGRQYVYRPTQRRDRVRNRALDHLVQTLFDGSASTVLSTLLRSRGDRLSEDELAELARLIEDARARRESS